MLHIFYVEPAQPDATPLQEPLQGLKYREEPKGRGNMQVVSVVLYSYDAYCDQARPDHATLPSI